MEHDIVHPERETKPLCRLSRGMARTLINAIGADALDVSARFKAPATRFCNTGTLTAAARLASEVQEALGGGLIPGTEIAPGKRGQMVTWSALTWERTEQRLLGDMGDQPRLVVRAAVLAGQKRRRFIATHSEIGSICLFALARLFQNWRRPCEPVLTQEAARDILSRGLRRAAQVRKALIAAMAAGISPEILNGIPICAPVGRGAFFGRLRVIPSEKGETILFDLATYITFHSMPPRHANIARQVRRLCTALDTLLQSRNANRNDGDYSHTYDEIIAQLATQFEYLRAPKGLDTYGAAIDDMRRIADVIPHSLLTGSPPRPAAATTPAWPFGKPVPSHTVTPGFNQNLMAALQKPAILPLFPLPQAAGAMIWPPASDARR